MSVGTQNSIKAALAADKLTEDDRIVLAVLVRAGFAEDGTPTGRAGKLSSEQLAMELYSRRWETHSPSWTEEKARIESCKRLVRRSVNSLVIRHGISIMCEPGTGGGYFLPATPMDVESNHHRFHRRAMTGLVKAARSRKSAYADAVVQLSIGFEEEIARLNEGFAQPGDDEGPPAWVEVVTRLLDRVKGDPDKYSAEIRKIQDQYGDIFVRRDQVAKIKELSNELNRVLEGLQ